MGWVAAFDEQDGAVGAIATLNNNVNGGGGVAVGHGGVGSRGVGSRGVGSSE